ncbi:MAG: hypothetical protein QM528_07780 [Phycisphaerales bacterium]|nr:hypothetical protein [Phycisphaerales bacterium]
MKYFLCLLVSSVLIFSCKKSASSGPAPLPPDPGFANIDRFSDQAGTIFRRSISSSLPVANAPINFNEAPFFSVGLDSSGNTVHFYNFDVYDTTKVFQRGIDTAYLLVFVPSLLDPTNYVIRDIYINNLPGDPQYTDFKFVYVFAIIDPQANALYKSGTYTSVAELKYVTASGDPNINIYSILDASALSPYDAYLNGAVVPPGSTCGATKLDTAWVNGKKAGLFLLNDTILNPVANPNPLTYYFDSAYVAFVNNPTNFGAGQILAPNGSNSFASLFFGGGYYSEGTGQTHNLVRRAQASSTKPYSSIRKTVVYDNSYFDATTNWQKANEIPNTSTVTLNTATGSLYLNMPSYYPEASGLSSPINNLLKGYFEHINVQKWQQAVNALKATKASRK